MDLKKLIPLVAGIGVNGIPLGSFAIEVIETIVNLSKEKPKDAEGNALTADQVKAQILKAFESVQDVKDTADEELRKAEGGV